jgi:predicted nuclease of predicted toxin-antitoxin system
VKFIVDAQLPNSLSILLKSKGHDSIHTLDFPQRNKTSDTEIIEVALKEARVIISKDLDFLESFLVHSKPRKLILVRTGNVSNKQLLKIFDNNFDLIHAMLVRSNLIELTVSEIVEHSA